MTSPSAITTARHRGASFGRMVGVIVLTAMAAGCDWVDAASDGPLDEVDPALYELEITSCEIEPIEDTIEALGEPLFDEERSAHLALDYTITNLDDERRRFDLRATSTDANGLTLLMDSHQTSRRDPQARGEGTIRSRVTEVEEPPFTCSIEVWDSRVDRAFPDD